MQPYQKATEAIKEHQRLPAKIAKFGLPLAGAALAKGTLKRILPFLSEHIDPEMSVKGVSKADPRLGNAMQHALDIGYPQDQINEHVRSSIEPEEIKQEPAKQNKNIIEQYSPELHQYILEKVQKGETPLAAATKATLDNTLGKKFKEVLEKISKQHKTPWHNIIESIYGSGQTAQPQQQATSPQPQPQAQPQQGQGLQAYMDVLGKIKNSLGV